MILSLLVPFASALTLDQAVKRAAEVDPDAVIASLEWKQARLDATGAWAGLGLTPGLSISRRFAGGAVSASDTLSVGVGALDPPAWFDAAQKSAQAREGQYTAAATALDAQYAAASLYYQALAADAALASAQEGERYAKATTDATAARVSAGLESELSGRSAQLGLLQAQATTAQAEADHAIAYARLGRALQQDIDTLEPAAALDLPGETVDSPWIAAGEQAVRAARFGHDQDIAALFPTGSLDLTSTLPDVGDWAVTVGLTWKFDGIVGPFLDVRNSGLAKTISEIELDKLKRDTDLGITTAREQARAADRVAEAARSRQALADESLTVGQARLAVGLASSLEVLRLQDEAAKARADRVSAELDAEVARLEARRLAGIPW